MHYYMQDQLNSIDDMTDEIYYAVLGIEPYDGECIMDCMTDLYYGYEYGTSLSYYGYNGYEYGTYSPDID